MGYNFRFTRESIKWNPMLFWERWKTGLLNLEAPVGRTGVKSNASFTFGALSRYSEGAHWIIEQCRGMGSCGLTKDHPLSRPELET